MTSTYIMIYEPAEDSFLLQKHINDYARGSVLDMGTGSGIQAVEAKKTADKVLAVDINPEAVKHCKELGLDCIQSDLFDNVSGKFDLIIFNAPYLPQDEGIEDPALYGGKEGFEIIDRFLRGAKNFLAEKGKILLLFSSITNKEKINNLIHQYKFQFKEIDMSRHFFEEMYVYEIHE